MASRLRFIPLGGLGEIGMNCSVLQSDESLIAIDCGIGFTDESGADVMHPDFSWLVQHRKRLEAIVITHGHEDHIGALPYLLSEARAPVYAPPYAWALIEDRLQEFGVKGVDLRESGAGHVFDAGPFTVERFAVHHSIADATGLILRTPIGTVVHTGDFKIEEQPADGQRFDRHRLERAGDDGVRLLLSDSTGADGEGRAGLERDAAESLEQLVASSANRVVVATFSSNFFRLRTALGAAKEHGRKVCLLGRSVRHHTEVAQRMGLLPALDAQLIAPEQVDALPRDQVMIIAAGTQGEPASALTRLARGEHAYVHLQEGDRVIMSSRVIPGNERKVFAVRNHLERRGMEVIGWREHPGVHASGHGAREEQREMIRLLRPQAFVPVHGTYHHLRRHADLAREEGVTDVAIIENGAVLEVGATGMNVVDSVPVGRVFVEGGVELDGSVMRERKEMGGAGMVSMVIALKAGRLHRAPKVVSRGVFDAEQREVVEQKLARHVRGQMGSRHFPETQHAERAAIEAARRFLLHNHKKRPLVAAVAHDRS